MMYRVRITEELVYEMQIEADSEERARDYAEARFLVHGSRAYQCTVTERNFEVEPV